MLRTDGLLETLKNVSRYGRWIVGGRLEPILDPATHAWRGWRGEVLEDLPSTGSMISVVCAVYNTDPWLLRACVESVVLQKYASWELLLVDDGSTRPETMATIEELAGRDPRIKVSRLPDNSGIATATNTGIRLATGTHVAFLDHDDLLHSEALARCASHLEGADLIYTDEDKITETGLHFDAVYKPSWSPRLLLSKNYVNHLVLVRLELLTELGGLRDDVPGAQDLDLLLRLSELPLNVVHIPDVLYHWRSTETSVAQSPQAKQYAEASGLRAVADAISRRGWDGDASLGTGAPFDYRVRWRARPDTPLVKIVIPTRDRVDLLAEVVDGVLHRTDGVRTHVVVVDNGSRDGDAIAYLDDLSNRPDVTVHRVDDSFNYSALCNQGAAVGPKAEFLLFLNNDIEIVHRNWLQQLLGWMVDPQVSAVGSKMVYPDGRIQHAGVVLGMGGMAEHFAAGLPDAPRLGMHHDQAREVSCVTAACVLVRAKAFHAVGGFQELLPVDFQDVDLCLRLGEAGGVLIYDPTYPVVHLESVSRGVVPSSPYTVSRMLFWWSDKLKAEDPYYSPHLSLLSQDFGLRRPQESPTLFSKRLEPRYSIWVPLWRTEDGTSNNVT